MYMINKLFIILSLFLFCSLSAIGQTYEEMMLRSAEYVEQGDYAAAEQTLLTAIRQEPGNPANFLLLANLGTIQRELKKYDEALISYSTALSREPKNIFLLHNRAALYCEMSQPDDAIKDYTTILHLSPTDTEALYRRGLIHLDRKDALAAAEDFEHIKTYDPDNLLSSLGQALILKKQQDWVGAEEIYNNLLLKNRTNADLFMYRGECYLNLGKIGRAQADLAKAYELGCNDPFFYILRGQVRLEQYDKLSAKLDFEKARELGVNEEVVDNFLKLCK